MKNPEEILKVIKNDYKNINKYISDIKVNKKNNKFVYIFLSYDEWMNVFSHYQNIDQEEFILLCSVLSWQYNKFIFKFNDNFLKYICDCKIEGNLPIEVLFRLPHPSIYIEVDDIVYDNSVEIVTMHGFWVTINYFNDNYVLNFIINLKDDTGLNKFKKSLHFIYLNKNITNMDELMNFSLEHSIGKKMTLEGIKRLNNLLLSLTLYICSSEPDIVDFGWLGTSKKDHQLIIKTRHGQKLLAAPKIRIFNVGEEIAKKLQSINEYESEDKSKRAHIRKAHWHGYWIGKGRTEFKYNWIHPVLVNVEMDHNND